MVGEDLPAGTPVTYSRQYRRCGKAGCLVCGPGLPGHGPYWYAFWREGGRKRSRYLGRETPPGLREVPATMPAEGHTAVPAQTARAVEPELRVRTLGGFAVWIGGEPVPSERWRRPTVAALFKALLGAPGHRLGRDQLLELFWPDAAPEQGAVRLRATVHRLRQALGDAGRRLVQYRGELLSLEAAGAPGWLDADAFEMAARGALAGRDVTGCRAALALYQGDYLPDDPYAEWAVGRREVLRGVRVALLLHTAALCEGAGEAEDAEGYLRSVLAADPCHEGAALALMRLYAAAGRSAQALRVYRKLAAALREDLDIEPEAQTRALYRIVAAQRPAQAAPAAPAEPAVPTNLPEPLTSFIGRRRDLAALRALLRPEVGAYSSADEAVPSRLLTLTGTGGVGKTRLALAVADDLLEDYPDGAWLVDFSPLGESGLVDQAVAGALGLREEPARPVLETLMATLRHRRLLLVLDNCEHLVGECADLVTALLAGCPMVRVLATSREPLGVAGERLWPVAPLSLPDAGSVQAARLLESESARLFLDRARAQRPDLELTEENAAAVAAICRRLDGLPLAIELAAARVRLLGVEQIAARLQQRLALLTGGPRAAAARQRTLRAALDWSHDLLSELERVLFRRLAVFAGGCTPPAVEAVCRIDGDLEGDVLECLGSLLDKSLLRQQQTPVPGIAEAEPRFGMLETVREYALEQLAAGGEAPLLQRRHADYLLGVAEEAGNQLRGPAQASWLPRLEAEHDNLRAALRWALDSGDVVPGLKLAGALWQFWEICGHVSEGRGWLERLLAHEGAAAAIATPTVRSAALNGAGALAFDQGDFPRATAWHEECLALRRSMGDDRGVAVSLNNLGNIAHDKGDAERALACYAESLAIKRRLDDRRGMAVTLSNMGVVAYEQGDHGRALALYDESLALKRNLGDRFGIAIALNNLGELMREQGDTARAVPLFEESLGLHRDLGNTRGIAIALNNLAHVARERGDTGRATALYAESLALAHNGGDRLEIAFCLEGFAAVAWAQGQPQRAAQLWGAAAALRAALGTPLPQIDRAAHVRTLAAARAALGEGMFSSAWAAGQAMPVEHAVAFALDDALSP